MPDAPEMSVDPPESTPPTGSSRAELLPDWLDNLAQLSWRVLVIIALLIVLWFIGTYIWTVTAAIALAIVVAAVLAPYVLRLRDRGRSRTAAAGIVWAAAMLVGGAVVVILALSLLPLLVDLVKLISDGTSELGAQLDQVDVPAWVSTLVSDAVEAVKSTAGDAIGEIVGGVANIVGIVIIATFLLFFFLRDGDRAWMWFFQGVGEQKRELITSAGDDALARVGGYLRGTTVLALIYGVSSYIFMVILGVPLAGALSLLAFVSTYIPYFGSLVTGALILLVTLGAVGVQETLIMVVLIGLRTAAISYFVRPQIYGRTVHIHPALVLIVLPAGLQLAGLVGLFAAVPVTAFVLAVSGAAITIMEPEEPPTLPDLVPAWLDRAAQWSWRALVAIALIGVFVLIVQTVPLVIIPVVLALIFAATLEPLAGALQRRGRSRSAASALSVAGTALAIVAVVALAMVSLVDKADELGSTTVSGAESVDESAGGHLGMLVDAVGFGAKETITTIATVTSDLAVAATIVLLSALLCFYFMRDGAQLWARLMEHTRSGAVEQLTASGREAYAVLGGYMAGTAAISFVGAASQFVIMVILGLPLALPVFVLSFLGGFIPYIGQFLTTLVAFLIAVAVGDPIDVVVMAIWTVVFNLVQGNIVAPVVYGRTVHIHPAIVLVSIPAASAVAGILGMFLVVPLAGVVAATWRTILSVMGTGGGTDAPTAPDQADESMSDSDDASSSAEKLAAEPT